MNRHRTAFTLGLLLSVSLNLAPQLTLAGDYADSAHGDTTIGVDRSSIDTDFSNYATGNCAHCHEQHASLGGTEPNPGSSLADYLLFDVTSINTFCNTCHDGSPVAGDVASQTIKTSGHDPATTKTPGSINAVCMDCHDPHAATEVAHVEATDGNTASGILKNVAGVRAIWTAPSSPSNGTETLSAPSYTATPAVTKEYELCLKCHSSYAWGSTPPTGWTDQGEEFNPYNFSFHPVSEHTAGQQWNNAFLRTSYSTAMNAPWNSLANIDSNSDGTPDARMHCSDCHADSTAGAPKGPHGSNAVYILRAVGPGTTYNNLCLLCHRPEAGPATSAFGNHTTAKHQYPSNAQGCLGCHAGNIGVGGRTGNVHGTNYRWSSGQPAIKFLVGGYISSLTSTSCGAAKVTGCGGHPGGKGY